jgi:hypothetical protein
MMYKVSPIPEGIKGGGVLSNSNDFVKLTDSYWINLQKISFSISIFLRKKTP